MKLQNKELHQNVFHEENQLATIFHVLAANIERTRSPITFCILTMKNKETLNKFDKPEISLAIKKLLEEQIRKSDMFYQLSDSFEWCIVLTQSGEKEAHSFIQRIIVKMDSLIKIHNLSLLVCIAEINNSDATFKQVVNTCRHSIEDVDTTDISIIFTSAFKERKIEQIKVSILEENEIFSHSLSTILENFSFECFDLIIREFTDGYEFLNSNWYNTSHTHIIIVNDILPRKNGLEVVHRIRELPNNGKFLIYMMTNSKSEQDMIQAYESGVDEYLIKPFNIRLFEAQMKRVLERLWS